MENSEGICAEGALMATEKKQEGSEQNMPEQETKKGFQFKLNLNLEPISAEDASLATEKKKEEETLGEGKKKQDATLGDLFGMMGGLMSAFAPPEDAKGIKKQFDEFGNKMESALLPVADLAAKSTEEWNVIKLDQKEKSFIIPEGFEEIEMDESNWSKYILYLKKALDTGSIKIVRRKPKEVSLGDLFAMMGGVMSALGQQSSNAESEEIAEQVTIMKSKNEASISAEQNEDVIKYEVKVVPRNKEIPRNLADKIFYRATCREAEINKDAILSKMWSGWNEYELADGQIKKSEEGGIVTKMEIPDKLDCCVIMNNRKENDDLDVAVESLFEEAEIVNKKYLAKSWLVATVREAEEHKEEIMAQMDRWYIAELLDGKVNGIGHGGKITKCVPEKFGHLVVIRKVQSGNM